MLQDIVRTAGQLLREFNHSFSRDRATDIQPKVSPSASNGSYQSLKRMMLTDGVARTIFEDYAAHRHGPHGEDETGWAILGIREVDEAVILATLPAGIEIDAGSAHVRFNSAAQALASRIIRQRDRRLTLLGVVHTHPGSLRHPSEADYQGDSVWVKCLRGHVGIFGIGTADGDATNVYAEQPKPHVQCLGELRLSWYSLSVADAKYRPLNYGMTLGPDLARPLHPLWSVIEKHAERLDRLCRQQTALEFEIASGQNSPVLACRLRLAEPGNALRIILEGNEVHYYLERHEDTVAIDCPDTRVDRSVYLILAELANQL